MKRILCVLLIITILLPTLKFFTYADEHKVYIYQMPTPTEEEKERERRARTGVGAILFLLLGSLSYFSGSDFKGNAKLAKYLLFLPSKLAKNPEFLPISLVPIRYIMLTYQPILTENRRRDLLLRIL